MLDNFSFLDEELAYEIVVTNTNKVLDMVEEIEVIIDTGGIPFSPRVKSDDGKYIIQSQAQGRDAEVVMLTSYDENGRISSYTDILSNNGYEKIYEFSYDENGRIITVSTAKNSMITVNNQSEINYTYSEDGRITQESILKVDDKTGETITTVYDYTNVK